MGVYYMRDWRIQRVFTIGVYYKVYTMGVYYRVYTMSVYHCPPSPYFNQYCYAIFFPKLSTLGYEVSGSSAKRQNVTRWDLGDRRFPLKFVIITQLCISHL